MIRKSKKRCKHCGGEFRQNTHGRAWCHREACQKAKDDWVRRGRGGKMTTPERYAEKRALEIDVRQHIRFAAKTKQPWEKLAARLLQVRTEHRRTYSVAGCTFSNDWTAAVRGAVEELGLTGEVGDYLVQLVFKEGLKKHHFQKVQDRALEAYRNGYRFSNEQ